MMFLTLEQTRALPTLQCFVFSVQNVKDTENAEIILRYLKCPLASCQVMQAVHVAIFYLPLARASI